MILALFQISLAVNKNSQQTLSVHGKARLLFWRARHTNANFKKAKRGKRIETRGNLVPKYGCGRDSPVLGTQIFQSFVVNMRWRESTSLECEQPSLVETGEENWDSDAECFYCWGLYTRDRRGEKWIKCTYGSHFLENNCRFVLRNVSPVQSAAFLNEVQVFILGIAEGHRLSLFIRGRTVLPNVLCEITVAQSPLFRPKKCSVSVQSLL